MKQTNYKRSTIHYWQIHGTACRGHQGAYKESVPVAGEGDSKSKATCMGLSAGSQPLANRGGATPGSPATRWLTRGANLHASWHNDAAPHFYVFMHTRTSTLWMICLKKFVLSGSIWKIYYIIDKKIYCFIRPYLIRIFGKNNYGNRQSRLESGNYVQ